MKTHGQILLNARIQNFILKKTTQIHTYKYMREYMHTYIPTYMYTYTHTRPTTRTHTKDK